MTEIKGLWVNGPSSLPISSFKQSESLLIFIETDEAKPICQGKETDM